MMFNDGAIVKRRPIIAVVVGGESGEHEISLKSGTEVLAGIDLDLWAPFVVRIERSGGWCFPPQIQSLAPVMGVGDGVNALLERDPDLVFPVMHGPYGEDGRFQALMELLHLDYVGSDSESSALAMHKARARVILAAAGLAVPPGQELCVGEELLISAPCVVKPMRLGSSVGLAVVKTEDLLKASLEEAFSHDPYVLVEQFVEGREFTAGVLEDEDGKPLALPIIEIQPKTSEFFDYHAKYTPGATDEICPAPIEDTLRDELQRIGLVAHKALGCHGMSRTDMIVDPAGKAWVLETNTIPGMTKTSLLPLAAREAGISFTEMINCLLSRALKSRR
ncbi:MAG TPA: D-alanine--D-alanine ligase [Myxococcales bacterium]|nr:D-alanine--D-alanine ligase [Myxococcales bacterium]